ENPPAAAQDRPANPAQANGPDRRAWRRPANPNLRFFRTIFGILIYALAALFLMSLIILRFHAQTIVIGALLFASVALFAVTYLPRWRR
ncbi:MAG: hypothetical protein KGL02_08515, partial [Acidobacteriota bacterium]|nr:hypothetical protein [Acidobacteriota bacterium]